MRGATIKQRLTQMGTTQTELARLLGISPQAVSGILSASDVRTGTVERICEVLHLPVSFFYDEGENAAVSTLTQVKGRREERIWQTENIGEKVRVLLREQHKKLVGLCKYVGITDPGLRKVFERDTCNIDTLTKIADYLSVPLAYFLPADSNATKEETDKDKEILFLRGQVKAYETAIGALIANGRLIAG